MGYTTHIIECSIEAIILELTKNDLTIEDSLFHQIEKRQTNRNIYNGNKISDGILQQLQSIPKENGIQFYFTEINTPFANTITQYIIKGNEIQMADIAFKNELLSWRKKIDSSSHFVVCTTQRDTIEEWINLGRTLQRFLLKVTEIGISYAFLNQPCEVAALAFDLREKLPVNKEHPTLIMRIGYAKQIPYSPRKKIETLLV